MAEPTVAELLKRLEELESKQKVPADDPSGSNVRPITNPIEVKGLHRQTVEQLKHLHVRTATGEEGLKVTFNIRVDGNPCTQTVVCKGAKWSLAPGSKTAAELAGEAKE